MTQVVLPDFLTVILWVDTKNTNMVAIQAEESTITSAIQHCVVANGGPRLRYAVVQWDDLHDTLSKEGYAALYERNTYVLKHFPTTALLKLYGHQAPYIKATEA